MVPYSPLGRGFFTGKGVVENLAANSILVQISPIYCVIYLLDFQIACIIFQATMIFFFEQ